MKNSITYTRTLFGADWWKGPPISDGVPLAGICSIAMWVCQLSGSKALEVLLGVKRVLPLVNPVCKQIGPPCGEPVRFGLDPIQIVVTPDRGIPIGIGEGGAIANSVVSVGVRPPKSEIRQIFECASTYLSL